MDLLEAIQAKALQSVLHPDGAAFMRHVKRYYSQTFHTPLHKVDELEETFVLNAYYEQCFETMSEEDRQDFVDQLTETEEEKMKRAELDKRSETAEDELLKSLAKEIQLPPRPSKPMRKKNQEKEAELPKPTEVQPNIHMSFSDSE